MRVNEHRWHRRVLSALLLVTVIGGLGTTTSAEVVIVSEGVPKATIVSPAGASEVVCFAAAELQRYIQKISGGELPIHEGQPPAAGAAIVLAKATLAPPRRGLEVDSFTVKSEGDRLLLTGNTDRAVLYAVYAFLESLGAAWLEPGEEGEIIPRMPTIRAADLNLAFTPAFDLRAKCIYDHGGGKQALDWMGKMRMNLALYPPEGYEKHGILRMAGTSHDYASRMGLPADWYKDPANFEHVAMRDGKRALPEGRDPADMEPCLSHEGAIERLLATSLEYLEENPDVYLFDMRGDDKMDTWCECEACSKHPPTDNYVRYVNRLATKVHAKWPQKKVSLIAYIDSMAPPQDILPDVSLGNLVLWFAPITRLYRQPFHAAGGGGNMIAHVGPNNKMRFPTTDGGWEPTLLAWQKVFRGPIFILDYYHWSYRAARRPSYFYMRPDVIAADLKHYHKLGISGSIGVEPCPLQLPNGWNQYLKAKLLWDPSLDVAELEHQYYGKLYGPCAEAARKCVTAMAKVLNAENNDAKSVEGLREAAARFAADVKGCEKVPAVEERVERIALWADYVILRMEYYRRLHEEQADALEKAQADLVEFIESNRTRIARHYNEVRDMIPLEILAAQKKAAGGN